MDGDAETKEMIVIARLSLIADENSRSKAVRKIAGAGDFVNESFCPSLRNSISGDRMKKI